MIPRRILVTNLAVLLSIFWGVSSSWGDDAVQVSIDCDTVVNEDILGIGWNVWPMSMPLEDSEAFIEFYRLLGETEQPWIRVGLQKMEWEGKYKDGTLVYANDDDDPWTSPRDFLNESHGGFVWNASPGLTWRITRLLDYCEENDIWVEMNNWECRRKAWLGEKYRQKEFYHQPLDYDAYSKDADEFGENIAAFLYYLKTRANDGKGYDCVKYYAIWNEPGGGHTDYSLATVDYPGSLNLLHKAVHEHLVRYDEQMGTHVRQELRCIGFESFPFWRNSPASGHPREDWDEMISKGVTQYLEPPDGLPGEITHWPSGDPYMDLISIHEYWVLFDYDPHNPSKSGHGTIKDLFLNKTIGGCLEQMRQYDCDGQREPLIIGELGAHVYSRGAKNPPNYDLSLFVAEAAIRALQVKGVGGISRWGWNMHQGYAAVSYPKAWYETEPKGQTHPNGSNFYPYMLLTKFIKRVSKVLSVEVCGGVDDSTGEETWPVVEANRVWAGAFLSPEEKVTLVVVNDSYLPKNLEVDFTGLSGEGVLELNHYYVAADKWDRIYSGETVSVDSGSISFTIEVPPRSISVYTEY